MTMTRSARQLARRAFSLVELLIVILIIALIIAIVLPALAHTRKAARKAATNNLMVQVSQACSSFLLSERRMPGYFTQREMGANENAARGFTGMENAMFELAGGVVSGTGNYGPTTAHLINYDANLVGVAQAGAKNYFVPPSKYFKFQDGVDGGLKNVLPAEHKYIRDLVDAEGTPLLLWVSDPMSVQTIAAATDFAKQASDQPAPATAARYYWNSNSAFLSTTTCGDKRIDESNNSLLGLANATGTPPAYVASLAGVLGSPSSPNNITNTGVNLLPTAGRGQFIIQSAGSNAIFVGKEERGGKLAPAGALSYDLNFRSQPSSDIMADFDDILIAGG